MPRRASVENSFRVLSRLYDGASDVTLKSFHAKLVLLEVCGWIEEMVDELVLKHAKHCLRDAAVIEKFQKDVVEKQWGLGYKENLVPMLIGLFGRTGLAEFESYFDEARLDLFKATLGTLRQARNAQAHTHVQGVTMTVMSPSVLRGHFDSACSGLADMALALRLMRGS